MGTRFSEFFLVLFNQTFERVVDSKDPVEQRRALEKQAVLISLENLMSFPFVQQGVKDEMLTLHGLWIDCE